MAPQQSEELALAVARVFGLALAAGVPVEVHIGGQPVPVAHPGCGCGACVTCLAESAAPEARHEIVLNALRLAWRARPNDSLGRLLAEAGEWLSVGSVQAGSDVDMLHALARVREEGR